MTKPKVSTSNCVLFFGSLLVWVLLAGCGDGSDTGGEDSCEGPGSLLVVEYEEAGMDIVADDPQLVKYGNRVIAIRGTSRSGHNFWLGRDGDVSDGAFDEQKRYDVALYPYHMVLSVWPEDSESNCEFNPQCET